jgi:hypothetical protein
VMMVIIMVSLLLAVGVLAALVAMSDKREA